MATQEECDAAFRRVAALLATVPPDVLGKHVLERRVSCKVSDLGVTWSAQLSESGLTGITTEDEPKAQIRLSVGSDDLLALVEGRQPVPTAFATGKLRVTASPMDMLRLTALLSL